MIPKHEMLDVTARAMHNPRASWFTVRPLSKKPTPYPFRVEHEATPAIAAQFAVEHPTDMDARRVITIATTEYGYAVWCGDKFTQGDATALGASLRVEMAVSDLPAAYVDGARAAMMSLYGSYPNRAPCHFWHAWHKDQGVCKHVAAALQFVERTHPEGVSGLLDELDDALNSMTTAPLTDLMAPRSAEPATPTATENCAASLYGYLFRGQDSDRPTGNKPVDALASVHSLAELALNNPAIKQFFRMSANPATPTDSGEQRATPAAGSPDDMAFDILKSLGPGFLLAPREMHPLFVGRVQRPAQPTAAAAPAKSPLGNAEYASRLAVQAHSRLMNLVSGVEPQLKQALLSLAGQEDAARKFTVWPVSRMASTNEQLRARAEYQTLAHLLFIADTPAEDGMFALKADADGVLRRPEVYRWDPKTNKVEWYAEDLAIYVRRRASEG